VERIYKFAIVRVSPDPRRGELVNIGIVVFWPRRLDVRILPSLSKVHALHGELDLASLHALPDRLSGYYRKARASIAERHALIKSIGIVELSDLGQFRARDDEDYARVVEELMTKLVKPTVGPTERVTATSKLYTEVRTAIRHAQILGRNHDDFKKHKIVQHYPVSADKGLYADFAGKNSMYYFTETIDFRVDRGIRGPKFNESAKAALVLRETKAQIADSRRILLFAATAETEIRVKPHLNLLGEFATEFVNFESAQDRRSYVNQLATAFGGLPLN
jgi:hypothetical protein